MPDPKGNSVRISKEAFKFLKEEQYKLWVASGHETEPPYADLVDNWLAAYKREQAQQTEAEAREAALRRLKLKKIEAAADKHQKKA